MAGLGETLGSPWPPLALLPWQIPIFGTRGGLVIKVINLDLILLLKVGLRQCGIVGVRRGVSKGVEDGRRLPARRPGHS
jgi:hypothetical protein